MAEPLISRVTTVTGDSALQTQPQNFEVPVIGTSISLPAGSKPATSPQKNNSRLVMGGPMMGFTVPRYRACPSSKPPTAFSRPRPRRSCPHHHRPRPVFAADMCAEACPASLLPQQCSGSPRARIGKKLEQHNLFDCIECGACSYVCPSNIPLVQYYRASEGRNSAYAPGCTKKSEHSLASI